MYPERWAGKDLRPTGPELLSPEDMRRIVQEVVGRPVFLMNVTGSFVTKALNADKMPKFAGELLLNYSLECESGAFALGMKYFLPANLWSHTISHTRNAGAPTDVVKEMTGREPESFKTVTMRYALRPGCQRTWGNYFRSLFKFLRILVTPGTTLRSLEETMSLPTIKNPVMAVNSENWKNLRNLR